MEWPLLDCDFPEELAEPELDATNWEETSSQFSSRAESVAREELEAEIERLIQTLNLQHVWDSEGGNAYTEDTLNRTIAFLMVQSDWLWDVYGVKAPVPMIGPGPNGTIDLYWKQPAWELLINIPAGSSEPATFYGHNYGSQKIKGSFDPDKVTGGIIEWLML